MHRMIALMNIYALCLYGILKAMADDNIMIVDLPDEAAH
jgi:hypothetical protein